MNVVGITLSEPLITVHGTVFMDMCNSREELDLALLHCSKGCLHSLHIRYM